MIGRLSLVRATAGREEEALRILRDLDQALQTFRGYVAGYCWVDRENPSSLGRLALWESEEDANHAAEDAHIMALRSQLHVSIAPGHREEIVDITSATQAAER